MVTILTSKDTSSRNDDRAIHTPFMSDRALAIENAQYIFRTMKDLGEEIEFKRKTVSLETRTK